jgi:hypothetical protein
MRTVRMTIDAANLDEVRAALRCASGLVLAVNALEDLVPGKANPVVLPRPTLDAILEARDALVETIGELTAPDEAPAE